MPELLDGTNHVAWFRAGETIFEPSGINYLGVPGLINAHNIIATLIVQVDFVRSRHPYFCVSGDRDGGNCCALRWLC